jgi:hypothetical protein
MRCALHPFFPSFIFLVVAASGAACRGASDPVLDLVDALRVASENRDAQAIADRLADDFKGNGTVDKAEATATLRRYFAAYESVHLAVYDLTVPRRTDSDADVSFRAEFTGSARRIGGLDGFLPPSAAERFSLHLVRRGSEWKVASAEWKPIEPMASPGG